MAWSGRTAQERPRCSRSWAVCSRRARGASRSDRRGCGRGVPAGGRCGQRGHRGAGGVDRRARVRAEGRLALVGDDLVRWPTMSPGEPEAVADRRCARAGAGRAPARRADESSRCRSASPSTRRAGSIQGRRRDRLARSRGARALASRDPAGPRPQVMLHPGGYSAAKASWGAGPGGAGRSARAREGGGARGGAAPRCGASNAATSRQTKASSRKGVRDHTRVAWARIGRGLARTLAQDERWRRCARALEASDLQRAHHRARPYARRKRSLPATKAGARTRSSSHHLDAPVEGGRSPHSSTRRPSLDRARGAACIRGPNRAGKTTLLEALVRHGRSSHVGRAASLSLPQELAPRSVEGALRHALHRCTDEGAWPALSIFASLGSGQDGLPDDHRGFVPGEAKVGARERAPGMSCGRSSLDGPTKSPLDHPRSGASGPLVSFPGLSRRRHVRRRPFRAGGQTTDDAEGPPSFTETMSVCDRFVVLGPDNDRGPARAPRTDFDLLPTEVSLSLCQAKQTNGANSMQPHPTG